MKNIFLGFVLAIACFGMGYYFNQTAEQDNIMATNYAADIPNHATINNQSAVEENRAERSMDRLMSSELETIRLFDEAAPSVVFINSSRLSRNYFSMNVTEVPQGSGTGFVWDKKGNIITNYHVIKDADVVEVVLSDGTEVKGEVVGTAPTKDLAVIKIDVSPSKLRPIPRGTSNDVKVGQFVFAIGNPFGLDQSLTTGIISALGREIKSPAGITIRDVIQTDAAINPGNSGGPLLNSSGELIGVNTAIYSPSGASAGIGFSIPSNVVVKVIPDLIEYGEIQRPVLGFEPLNQYYMTRWGIKGVGVKRVNEGSPAEQAGLQSMSKNSSGNYLMDVIVAIDNEKVDNFEDLYLILEKYKPGNKITIEVNRNGETYEMDVTLTSNSDIYR